MVKITGSIKRQCCATLPGENKGSAPRSRNSHALARALMRERRVQAASSDFPRLT
jgi:hypothetical protein